MIGGAELFLASLLHLVSDHGTTVDAEVVLVNNTDFTSAVGWSEIYRYRGVPNVTSYYVITSPGFPHSCCSTWETQINASVVAGKPEHMFLICTDFDVPPRSQLRLWSGSHSFMPEKKWEGQRARPIHWLPRGYLRVDFVPLSDEDTAPQYAGFRCIVWETGKDVGLDEWQPRPIDTCNRLADDPLANGAIRVNIWPSELRIDFFYDCVWQLKLPNYPDSGEDWGVYILVQDMDVDGLLEIREGMDSTAPLLATNRKTPSPNHRGLESLHQPVQGFVSRQGLFIKLIKPYYEGKFVFNYGTFAFKKRTAPQPQDYNFFHNDMTCTLRINDKRIEDGFLCNSTQWCIPYKYACDDYPNCPDGSDEGDLCRAAFFNSHNCGAGKRMCKKRECVLTSERCPEDGCPEDRPHKCDDDYTCFGPAQMCDGERFCNDATDEDCSHPYDFSHIYPILGAICGACALIIIVCVAIWWWRRKRLRRGNRDAEGVMNVASDVPMMEMSGRRGSVEQEALINDATPTPPSAYEDNVNEGADHESTTSLTHDHN